MSKIKSTYNFVPAPSKEKVVEIKDSAIIAQDIPFQDGESGCIEFTLKAERAVFVKHAYPKNGKPGVLEFCHNHQGKHFIPGTTIKGMVRNNLEILTNSRLNKELVNNHRYGYRDFNETQYMNSFKPDIKDPIVGGWLRADDINDNTSYKITSYGKVYWVKHEHLGKLWKNDFGEKI